MVEDDGIGFEPNAVAPSSSEGGFGLVGIRERVGLVKGNLVVESSPGEGTSLRVTVPLAPLSAS
jgi:signal transduction histidine kinase